MDFSIILHSISIVFGLFTAILGVALATAKKKSYGWFIAMAFAIWVFCEVVKFIPNLGLRAYLALPPEILYLLFFAASLSILYAVWRIYKEG